MSTRHAFVLAAPLLLVLSACEDEPEVDTQGDGREASGEVLEGTISDEMLPLDEVRSRAPLALDAEEDGEGESSEDGEEPSE